PVLEEPELLELLRELERRLRETMEGLERRLAVGVEALVLEARHADPVAIVGDRVLREIERAAVRATDDLVHVRIRGLLRRQPDLQRAHLRGGTISGLPARSRRTLRGRRVDCRRAGMTPRTRSGGEPLTGRRGAFAAEPRGRRRRRPARTARSPAG